MRRCVIVNLVYFDRCRLEKDYGFLTAAAALLALAALPPVLAEAAAAALLAPAALPPVLAEAAAAALLALAAPPPVLADAAATAVLAQSAMPPVLADGVKTRNSKSLSQPDPSIHPVSVTLSSSWLVVQGPRALSPESRWRRCGRLPAWRSRARPSDVQD